MAQLTEAIGARIDLDLTISERRWDDLPEVEQEIDSWDQIDAIVFIEEWPLEEMRSERLAEYAAAGYMTPEQDERYRRLLHTVSKNRPIIRALQNS